jgi:hypothetical protein
MAAQLLNRIAVFADESKGVARRCVRVQPTEEMLRVVYKATIVSADDDPLAGMAVYRKAKWCCDDASCQMRDDFSSGLKKRFNTHGLSADCL